MQSHSLRKVCFGQYQASSAVLGWPGDVNASAMCISSPAQNWGSSSGSCTPRTPLSKATSLFLSLGGEAADKEEEDKKEEGGKDEKVELKCCVMLQKELAEGLTDEECGRAVEEGHAGLCE